MQVKDAQIFELNQNLGIMRGKLEEKNETIEALKQSIE